MYKNLKKVVRNTINISCDYFEISLHLDI